MHSFEEFIEVIAKLRSEHGCPWDREQTFESMKQYLANETQEVYEAVDKKDPLVIALKQWIDAEYEGGRQTSLSVGEIEELNVIVPL